jgi:hypothetical protein
MLGQVDCRVEVIVVEQSERAEFGCELPNGARHVHTPLPANAIPYNRSWALNAGCMAARAPVLGLLDADMLVTNDFARRSVDTLNSGYDAVRPVRMIFYLDQLQSSEVQDHLSFDAIKSVEQVRQNAPNPIVIRKDIYTELGGHDEAFFGWGGEDIEFTDRLRCRRYLESGFLPLFHLWHKKSERPHGLSAFMSGKMSVPATERIARLSQLAFGREVPTSGWPRDFIVQ